MSIYVTVYVYLLKLKFIKKETLLITNVMFQISPLTNEQKMWHQHSLSYVRMTIDNRVR